MTGYTVVSNSQPGKAVAAFGYCQVGLTRMQTLRQSWEFKVIGNNTCYDERGKSRIWQGKAPMLVQI